MSIFICPVCGQKLVRGGAVYKCANNHSFDISAQGYVNLLKNSKRNSGDNADMMTARTRFLNSGYYACLKDALSKCVYNSVCSLNGNPLIIDAGCGEGYYTSAVAQYLKNNNIDARIAGIDISKKGIKSAAKRDKSVFFAVAGIFDMPFESGSAAAVMSVFAPVCESEFHRVLAPGGALIIAGPGKDHLMGLKKAVYDIPYVNEEKPLCPDGFEIEQKINVKSNITVFGQSIMDLFKMTPYFWNTPKEDAKRLEGLEKLETPIDFVITVLKKQ
jgi:23S rRNA (guanine745-N1)-methyltransferase